MTPAADSATLTIGDAMTEKLESFLELFDTRSEILAWIIIICAVVFEFREFSDAATVALFLLATGLLGYTRRAQAGPFTWETKDDNDRLA